MTGMLRIWTLLVNRKWSIKRMSLSMQGQGIRPGSKYVSNFLCGLRPVSSYLLRVPRTARRSNQSILKEISPEYSLEELMLKLKLQNSNTLATWCKELTHWKRPWCWKRLKAGGEGHDRGWDGWMASLIRWTWVWASSGSWWWTGKPGVLQSTGSQRVEHNWATELNWTSSL